LEIVQDTLNEARSYAATGAEQNKELLIRLENMKAEIGG